MVRTLAAAAVGLALAGCAADSSPPPSAGTGYAMLTAPECRAATPGNSVPGFRCTGDYAGDAGGKGR